MGGQRIPDQSEKQANSFCENGRYPHQAYWSKQGSGGLSDRLVESHPPADRRLGAQASSSTPEQTHLTMAEARSTPDIQLARSN